MRIDLFLHDCSELHISQLLERMKDIMATVQEVKDAIASEAAQVAEHVNALIVEIQALKDQVAAGSAATPEQLDELLAAVEGIFSPTPPPAG